MGRATTSPGAWCSPATLAGIAAEDIGRTALGIFARGHEFIGATVSVAGEYQAGERLAAAFAEVLGEPVAYRPLTHGQFRVGHPRRREIGKHVLRIS